MNPSHQSTSAFPGGGDLYCYQPSIQQDITFAPAHVHTQQQLSNANSPVTEDSNKFVRAPCNAYFSKNLPQPSQQQHHPHHILHRQSHQFDSNSRLHPPQMLYYPPNNANHRSRNVAFQLASKPHISESSFTPVLLNGYSNTAATQAIVPSFTQQFNDPSRLSMHDKNSFDWANSCIPPSSQSSTANPPPDKFTLEDRLLGTTLHIEHEGSNDCILPSESLHNSNDSPSRQSNLTTPPTDITTPLASYHVHLGVDDVEPSRYQKSKSNKANNPYGSSLDALVRVIEIDQNDADRKQFADRLRSIWIEHSIKLRCLPTITKIPIDLFMLYSLVKERNGYIEVTIKKRWREVANGLGIFNCQSAAFGVKRNYTKLGILHYECIYDLNGSDPEQILKDIEAQKPPPSSRKRKRAQRSDQDSNSPNDTIISGSQSNHNEGSMHGHSPKSFDHHQHMVYSANRNDDHNSYTGQQMKLNDNQQSEMTPHHMQQYDRYFNHDMSGGGGGQQYSMYAFSSPQDVNDSTNHTDMYYSNRPQRIYVQTNGQMISNEGSLQHQQQLLSQNYHYHQVRCSGSPSLQQRVVDEYGCTTPSGGDEYVRTNSPAQIIDHTNHQYYQVTASNDPQQFVAYECSPHLQQPMKTVQSQYQQQSIQQHASFPLYSSSSYVDEQHVVTQSEDYDPMKMYESSSSSCGGVGFPSMPADQRDQPKSPLLPSTDTAKLTEDERNVSTSSCMSSLIASLASQQRRRRNRKKLQKLEMKDIHSLLLKLESGLQCEVSQALNTINNALIAEENSNVASGGTTENFDLNRVPRLTCALASTLKRSINRSSNCSMLLSTTNLDSGTGSDVEDNTNKNSVYYFNDLKYEQTVFNECSRCNEMDSGEFNSLACSTAIRNLSFISSNRSCLAKNHLLCKLLMKILSANSRQRSNQSSLTSSPESHTCAQYLHAVLKENSLVTLSNIAESLNLMSISEQSRRYFTKTIYMFALLKCPLYTEPHLTLDLLAIEILTKLATTTLENRDYLIGQCTDDNAQKLFHTIAKWLVECKQVVVQSDHLVKAELAICLLLFLLENKLNSPRSSTTRRAYSQSALLLQGLLIHLRQELQSSRSGSDKCALKCARCILALTNGGGNSGGANAIAQSSLINPPSSSFAPLSFRLRNLLESNLVDLLFTNGCNTGTTSSSSNANSATSGTARKLSTRRRKATQFSLDCESVSSLLAQCLRKLKPNR